LPGLSRAVSDSIRLCQHCGRRMQFLLSRPVLFGTNRTSERTLFDTSGLSGGLSCLIVKSERSRRATR
jgi:hypothetical protein